MQGMTCSENELVFLKVKVIFQKVFYEINFPKVV